MNKPFILYFSESCYCGNSTSYSQFGIANNCDKPCVGNTGILCGGVNAINVYNGNLL